MTSAAWVVGARGLLGRALSARLATHPAWAPVQQEPLPWHDDAALVAAAAGGMRRLLEHADGRSWAVFWTAGTVVTSSRPEAVADELEKFDLVLTTIASVVADRPRSGPGAVFLASSAGGVYAGSSGPPFDEATPPAPISPYGRLKLDAEQALASFTARTGISSAAGRISNLYGPGQSLAKTQGLVSHLARAHYTGTPVPVYVPLDTLRDYLYVDDATAIVADLVLRALDEHARTGPIHVVKNVIRGQAVSISTLLGYFRTLAKGHPRIITASSPDAQFQALDLRLASTRWTELDAREFTPMPAGIHATMADILLGLQAGVPPIPVSRPAG